VAQLPEPLNELRDELVLEVEEALQLLAFVKCVKVFGVAITIKSIAPTETINIVFLIRQFMSVLDLGRYKNISGRLH
jgi:hypothetical protein